MPKRWRIAPHDPARIADSERAAGIPSVVAQLLLGRGIRELDAVSSFSIRNSAASATPSCCPASPQRPTCSTRPSARSGGSPSTATTTPTA